MELARELAPGAMLPSAFSRSNDCEIVRRWMEMVLGDKVLSDVPAALQSGQVLCDLVKKLYQALGMKSHVRSCDGDDVDALSKVLEYLRACEGLGVARQDLFEPDDLLEQEDLAKVYRSILALQAVAVSLSNRRSIDERSSMIERSDWCPMLVHDASVNDDEYNLDTCDRNLDSHHSVHSLQQSRWQRLLCKYENQQQQKEEGDCGGESSACEGMGPLAHGIWRTEEHIRAILLREDTDYGAVPDALHGKLWMLASGAQLEMRRNKGLYERLLVSSSEVTEATRQIDVDLHRTVSDEDKEWWSDEKSGMMRRVLVAYSFYNPSLGYCQGLNYIVARILQYLDEEEAFYLLIAIIRLVPDDYYTTMLGLAVDQHVFADLVRLQYPEVSDHLTKLGGSGMELSLACTEWFLTLFASPCDRDVTFRIWDAIFLQGDEVLFRAALALLQQAKSELVACNNYGDMLKQLNELGRSTINAAELMKLSKSQDCIICGRVEDFRAHHRLQLASGIVASTVDTEDGQSSSTGRRSSESRPEPRLRLFGRRKQGVHRHVDKVLPRLARTFDRNLTDEYTEAIRRDHVNFAEYYTGMQLQIREDYCVVGDSHLERKTRSARRVSADGFVVSNKQENTGCCAELTDHDKSQNGPDGGECGAKLTRSRRSKSSAAMTTRKVQDDCATSPPADPTVKENDEEVQLVGRSPLAWIQRFEEWHKDMKTQKEKRKAEKKRLRRNQRCDSMFPETMNGQTDPDIQRARCAVGSSPVPLHSQPRECGDMEIFSLGDRRRPNEYKCLQTENVVELKKSSLPRSYSDLFRPPAHVAGQRQNQTVMEATRDTAKQGLVVPQQSPKDEIEDVLGKAFVDETRNLARSGNGRAFRGLSDQSTLSRSTNSCANAASFVMDFQEEMHDEMKSNRCLGEESVKTGQVTTFARGKRPLAQGLLLYSPVHCRSSSMDFGTEAAGDCVPPRLRRIVSVSSVENTPPQQKCARNLERTNDCTQAMRERANVLQYMHHKASDVSSVAGSIPRSPGRISEGSSNSPRFGDQSSNNRSGKSTHFRNGSFSFFDKLSSDLENSAHGLDSLVSEAEFSAESLNRGSISSATAGRSSTVDEQRPMGEAISISS